MNYDREPDEVIEPYKRRRQRVDQGRLTTLEEWLLLAVMAGGVVFSLVMMIFVNVPLLTYCWHWWMD